MNRPDYEEMAALHAAGLLDDAGINQLFDAAERDPAVRRLVNEYVNVAAELAHDAPIATPPPELRDEILHNLPGRGGQIIPFTAIVPYAIAACLMILAIGQTVQVGRLKSELRGMQARALAASTDAERMRQSNALAGLRVATLDAKDPAYAAAKIIVAWDPYQHRGVASLDGLPAAPDGHDYQLWVLDPNALAPVSVGVVKGSRPFESAPISTPYPGFAISLEPAGGSPSPTGPILFAVAPAP